MNDKCNQCKYCYASITQEELECAKMDLCINNSLFEPFNIEKKNVISDSPNKREMINHPNHYNMGKYEAIDVIEDWKLNFHLGNTIKYISRAGYKDDIIQDLKKARWYLDREIQRLENK